MKRVGRLAVLVCAGITLLAAQQSPPGGAGGLAQAPLQMDEPEIHAAAPRGGTTAPAMVPAPRGIQLRNATLRSMIAHAWGVSPLLVTGKPLSSDKRYDISADFAGQDAAAAMERLRQSICDKFHVAVTQETRQTEALVLQRPLTQQAIQEGSLQETQGGRSSLRVDAEGVAMHNMPFATLIRLLEDRANAAVIDESGLNGKYDLTLQWPNRPHDFPQAIRSQLGLGAAYERRAVEMLVVRKQ